MNKKYIGYIIGALMGLGAVAPAFAESDGDSIIRPRPGSTAQAEQLRTEPDADGNTTTQFGRIEGLGVFDAAGNLIALTQEVGIETLEVQ